jgi:hypothetical protein
LARCFVWCSLTALALALADLPAGFFLDIDGISIALSESHLCSLESKPGVEMGGTAACWGLDLNEINFVPRNVSLSRDRPSPHSSFRKYSFKPSPTKSSPVASLSISESNVGAKRRPKSKDYIPRLQPVITSPVECWWTVILTAGA